MSLNSSGPISLIGTIPGQSIELELGGTGTTQLGLLDPTVRTLSGIASGAIVMPTNFYNTSWQIPFTGWNTPPLLRFSGFYPGGYPGGQHSMTCTPAGLFVLVGCSTSGLNARVASATDGFVWTQTVMGTAPYSTRMGSVASNSSGLCVSVGCGNKYFSYSPTGAYNTWATPALLPTGFNAAYDIAVNSSGLFVAAGSGVGTTGAVTTTTNGTSWSAATTVTGLSYIWGLGVNPSGLFVAIGSPDGSSALAISTSTDTINWTPRTIPNPSGYSLVFNGITCSPTGRFVAVARIMTRGVAVTTSTDGVTWSNWTALTTTVAPWTIAVNPSGLFIILGTVDINAVTAYGVYSTSTDGVNWSAFLTQFTTTTLYSNSSLASNPRGKFSCMSATSYGSYSI